MGVLGSCRRAGEVARLGFADQSGRAANGSGAFSFPQFCQINRVSEGRIVRFVGRKRLVYGSAAGREHLIDFLFVAFITPVVDEVND